MITTGQMYHFLLVSDDDQTGLPQASGKLCNGSLPSLAEVQRAKDRRLFMVTFHIYGGADFRE